MSAPLFLVGAQRSGTTALAHALSAQYEAQRRGLFTVNGKLWYFVLRWLDESDLAARHFRADEISHALLRRPPEGAGAEPWLATVEVGLRDLAARVADGAYPADRGGVLAARRDLAGAVSPSVQWGDKYNEYLLQLAELHVTFPTARWLFLFRSPAEVIASMLTWHGNRPWNPTTARAAEAKWIDWNSRWLAFREQLGPGQALELDYADLCSGVVVAELERFVGLDLSAALSGYNARPGSEVGSPPSPAAAKIWASLRRTAVTT